MTREESAGLVRRAARFLVRAFAWTVLVAVFLAAGCLCLYRVDARWVFVPEGRWNGGRAEFLRQQAANMLYPDQHGDITFSSNWKAGDDGARRLIWLLILPDMDVTKVTVTGMEITDSDGGIFAPSGEAPFPCDLTGNPVGGYPERLSFGGEKFPLAFDYGFGRSDPFDLTITLNLVRPQGSEEKIIVQRYFPVFVIRYYPRYADWFN